MLAKLLCAVLTRNTGVGLFGKTLGVQTKTDFPINEEKQ